MQLLHFMWSGEMPYSHLQGSAVAAFVLEGGRPSLQAFPTELSALISWMWSEEPTNRPTFVQASADCREGVAECASGG